MVLKGENIRRLYRFKYLGLLVEETDNMEGEIKSRIQTGWKNWREASGVMNDRTVYKTAVRPTMLYDLETVQVKQTKKNSVNVAKMRILI